MEVSSAYSDLLQPLRNLCDAWNIEVSVYLEDYMKEVSSMKFSFDGGNTTMNFAEAALLIQSSACLYSKKVEHLYDLVYQALEFLTEKKKKENRLGSENEEALFLDEIALLNGPDLLPLDDIPETEDIDIKESAMNMEGMSLERTRKSLLIGSGLQIRNSTMRSDGASIVVPLEPSSQEGRLPENTDLDFDNNFQDHPGIGDNLMNDFDEGDVDDYMYAQGLPREVGEWTLLDPHEESDLPVKKLMRAKTYTLPSFVKEITGSKEISIIIARQELNEEIDLHISDFIKEDRPILSLNSSCIPELSSEYRKITRKRHKKLLNTTNLTRLHVNEELLRADEEVIEYFEGEALPPVYEEADLDIFEAPGFEELARSYTEKFRKESEAFREDTELSKRIRVWENFIEPKLEEAEKRKMFSIDEVCNEIVDIVKRRADSVEFADILEEKDDPNVLTADVFVSLMQLATEEKLVIDDVDGLKVSLSEGSVPIEGDQIDPPTQKRTKRRKRR